MSPEITRRTVAVGLLAVVVMVVAMTAAIAVAFDPPQVSQMQSEFGEVSEENATVHTTVVVNNPNDRALPGGVDLRYAVVLNDVEVATGVERSVRIQPGENTIETTAEFDNSKIPAWWVTHINNGEQTTMTTQARVGVSGLPVAPRLPTQSQEISTDLLGPLADSEESTVVLADNEVLVVGDQQAEWGEADEETTPLTFSTELENVHDRPVTLDGTEYEVRMNGVVVGEGTTDEGVELQPGESKTFRSEAALDTQKMQDWWVTHLENDQTTDLTVVVYPVVEEGGEQKQLPLSVFDRRATFETDLLGTGETSVTLRETDEGPQFTEPEIQDTTSEWGEVREDETDIETTIDVVNDNGEAFNDLLTLRIDRRTTLAGVEIADSSHRIERLPRGEGQISLTATKDHSVVPEWWAAHLRNDETSQLRTEATGEADVAVTTLPLDLDNRTSTVETNLLADLNDDSQRTVTSEETGQTLLTVHSTSAEWDNVSAEDATIVVTADLENENPLSSVTIKELDYTVDLNSVRLADDRAPQEHTLDPGDRKTVQFTLTLNNSKMEQWWPTHIRNDETSELNRDVVATVETDGDEERVELDFLSETRTVETNILGDEEE